MEKNNPQFITVFTHCCKCETKLLHVDITFVSAGGRVWVLPSPFCTACNRMEHTEMYT